MKFTATHALVALIASSIINMHGLVRACGDYDVSITCEDANGTPCDKLTPLTEPFLACQPAQKCATELEMIYTGIPCRGEDVEEPEVGLCNFNVHHEDCEEEDDLLDKDYMTECLEYKPDTVMVTATGRDGEVIFFTGAVTEGETFVLKNINAQGQEECLPNYIKFDAVELDGYYDTTGVDFRTELEIMTHTNEPLKKGDYGAFEVKKYSCDTRDNVLYTSPDPAACMVDVDVQVCVSTTSEDPLYMRFEELAYNKKSLVCDDLALNGVSIDKDNQWCRTVSTTMDICRKKQSLDYKFGIHNFECSKRTVLSMSKFMLT